MVVKKSLVSIRDLSREDMERIFRVAEELSKKPDPHLLSGLILASCFFEPSTRTRLSFETAMLRLGGKVIGFSDTGSTSLQKGESLHDTMRVMGEFADILVIRHPEVGSAEVAAMATSKPVINGGDGANEHPSQTLIDLFTIQALFGKIDGLKIALVGDLKYGRTIHSLVEAFFLYSVELYFVSPKEFALPTGMEKFLKEKGVFYSFHEKIEEIVGKVDVIYMTRLQKERLQEGEKVVQYGLKKEMLFCAKPHLKILHPLPRLSEIPPDIDSTPFAAYFQQAKNGVAVRMALLAILMTN